MALVVIMLIGLTLGCGSGRATRTVSLTDLDPSTPNQSLATDVPIRIAVSAMISPQETLDVYQELLAYIGVRLGRRVELVQRKTYAEVNALVRERKVSAAFVCSQGYVEGRREGAMEILAAPQVRGETVYYSYIIVPAESPVQSFEDLRGRSFSFVDPMSNTGKLVPTFLLAQKGERPESFFSQTKYTNSHSNSIKSVARGLVDGAAVDSLVFDFYALTQPAYTSRTRIVETSPPYGIPPLVVHPDLDPTLKDALRQVVFTTNKDPVGRRIIQKIQIDRFVPITDGSYDSVRSMLDFVSTFEREGAR